MSALELEDIKKKQLHKQQHIDYGQLSESNDPSVLILGTREHMDDDDAANPPVDHYNLVQIILLIHGVGTLMPWNMFINAEGYFRNYKLSPNQSHFDLSSTTTTVAPLNQTQSTNVTDTPIALDRYTHPIDITYAQLADYRENFLIYISIASQVPNVIFSGLNLLVNLGSGNLKLRVNFTLVVVGLVFILTIVLAALDSSQWPGKFFYLTIASVVVMNMASGVYQNCVFATGAKFPGSYTNAILIGSNISGTFTAIVNLLSIWLAARPQDAAMYYFTTALVVIIICFITYNLLPLNRFYRFHDKAAIVKTSEADQDTLDDFNDMSKTIPTSEITELRKTVDMMVPRNPTKPDETCKDDLYRKWIVFKKCWPQLLNVFLIFYVTLALFPAVLAGIQQSGSRFDKKYFTPVTCFLFFNAFAMIGNFLPGWTTWPGKKYVWILVVLRLLFVPYFLFCNFHPLDKEGNSERRWPVLMKNDKFYMIGNILMAFSSGYLSSLCMMFASSDLSADEAPRAGMLAAFFLIFGIFLGINTSNLLTWLVKIG